jgi:hypothetical protein
MATVTVAGTWTPLNVNFAKTPKTGPNQMRAEFMQLEQLKDRDLPELQQFVEAMAAGYGIPFNAAKQLFYHVVVAFMNRETPAVSRSYAA